MSQPFQRAEGVVLKAVPFRDYDHILTLFTPEEGILPLLVHGSRSKRRGIQGLCVPLTRVDAVYREKGGEIFSCQELTLRDSYPQVRKNLTYLEVACDLLNAISVSQSRGKPAPSLYRLLYYFLERIPQASFPKAISLCFRLKLLKHDGLAAFPFRCSSCGHLLLTEAYTTYSEGWCIDHRPVGSAAWNQKSLDLIYRLAISQDFHEICKEEISPQLERQVQRLFDL